MFYRRYLLNYITWLSVKYSVWWILALPSVKTQDPIVNIPQGRVAGTKVYAENSLTPIEIYYGIPYANPPVGRYRFSAPERHAGWRRTYSAHRLHPRCPQINDDDPRENYNEDCLFLNIWTSRRADGKSMPVVVVLYSETWDRGGISLPCEEIAAEGLVVVTISYRLGILSFFTLRTKLARGNLALLDQYLALLWVRDNIAAFGGDPSAITLIGHSAGADSILYHIVSPRSTGLFQRAVLMSPRDIWKAVDDGKVVPANKVEEDSRKLARLLGCTGEADQEILQCMQDKPLIDILSSYARSNLSMTFEPVADDFLPVSEQYLPNSLAAALSSAKHPILQLDLLLGTTELEDINHNDDRYMKLMNENPSYIAEYSTTKRIPEILKMFSFYHPDSISVLSQAVRWEYWSVKSNTDQKKESLEAVEGLARMESSAKWSVGSALLAARLARRISRLYVYRYLQPSATDLRGIKHNFTGAIHGADLIALMGDALLLQIARRHTTQEEKRSALLLRQYMANFIKFGSPDQETIWQRYKVGEAYVHAIYDNIKIQNGMRGVTRDATFWLQYLPQLNNILTSKVHSEELTASQGDSRFREGVFAMCGVTTVLLVLLCLSAIILHKERACSFNNADDIHR